jgi:hypothetical protein
MLMRARNLVVMLLVLMLPWQSFAALAVSTAAHHHDGAAGGHAASIDGTAHHAHDSRAADQNHDHAGISSDPGDGSTAIDATCADVCCSPALATYDPMLFATMNHHGWVIPFAMHRLPSPALDPLERPPSSFLV